MEPSNTSTPKASGHNPSASYLSLPLVLDLELSIRTVCCTLAALVEVLPRLFCGLERPPDTYFLSALLPLPSPESWASPVAIFFLFFPSGSPASACCNFRHLRTSLSPSTQGSLRTSRRKSRILSQKSTSWFVDTTRVSFQILICLWPRKSFTVPLTSITAPTSISAGGGIFGTLLAASVSAAAWVTVASLGATMRALAPGPSLLPLLS